MHKDNLNIPFDIYNYTHWVTLLHPIHGRLKIDRWKNITVDINAYSFDIKYTPTMIFGHVEIDQYISAAGITKIFEISIRKDNTDIGQVKFNMATFRRLFIDIGDALPTNEYYTNNVYAISFISSFDGQTRKVWIDTRQVGEIIVENPDAINEAITTIILGQ